MGRLFIRRSTDVQHQQRAAVILDGLYQFVALLNPEGDILEVNRAALDGAGNRIEEIRGKPFWTARWWQVSEKIREELEAAIRRAAAGEFVRYEVQIYGENAGLTPITIDFSLQPIGSESGEVEYLLAEGRNITERKRAEEEVARQSQELRALNERLKELDRLKTQFFANVSHEFRTPLALMLGPLEEVLREGRERLSPEHHEQLVTARRNALRLLKLVNTLLDFSRIEAGRVQAVYEPTDLAAITSEIAGVFRSAMENGGLRFSVECQPIPEPVYVDRDMWEKVVLNLLSNAFKFTFEGEVAVTLKPVDAIVELQVRDTGVGISEDEQGRIFERFHLIEGTRARTYEGTGIGLALVQELVKLHGGNVRVESAVGLGSTFTVTLPPGRDHLPAERIQTGRSLASTAVAAEAYAEEALRWLPDEWGAPVHAAAVPKPASLAPSPRSEPAAKRELIVVADDNADMRQYLKRLLDDRYDVQLVADGREALETTRRLRPSLVLADVMMPQLDGFGLLRAIRDDAALASMPVILVSARAGEESRVEGLQAGADDYLVKPFAAGELLARVEAHSKMSNLRRETAEREERLRNEAELERQRLRASEERLAETSRLYREVQNREAQIRRLVEANIVGIFMWNLEGAITGANEAFLRTVQYDREDLASGRVRWTDLTPAEWSDRDGLAIAELKASGVSQPYEKEYFRKDGSRVPILLGGALFEASGSQGVAFVLDLTEQKQAAEKIRQSEMELRQVLELAPQMVAVVTPDPARTRLYTNQTTLDYCGCTLEEWRNGDHLRFFHPDDWERVTSESQSHFTRGLAHEFEARLRRKDGQYRWILFRWSPIQDEQGQILRWYVVGTDIEDRKQSEQRLQNENVALREEIDRTSMFEEIVGTSPPLQSVLSRISKVAPADSSVLIAGETGTGKELVARAIHKRSRRSSRPFVSVNCAAIPRELIASELFGHEKGAFTGATQRRLGRFELAEGGTIFLDEIGDLPSETQIALLRVLQEHEFERVGGTGSIRANVRVIAATNRDLEAAIAAGMFRSDLFYRLNVFPIEIPPLRERRKDIPLLVGYFIDRYASKSGKKFQAVNKESLNALQSYPWPGNIRELQNVIERSVIVCETENFSVDESWLSRRPSASEPKVHFEFSEKVAAQEKEMIEAALRETGGRVYGPSGAAAKLGMPGTTLDSKIKTLKISKNRFKTA